MKVYFQHKNSHTEPVKTIYLFGDSPNPYENAIYELFKTDTARSITITFYGFTLYYEKIS